jgi:pimeloyl-ACP methyl ester carboxylesterase
MKLRRHSHSETPEQRSGYTRICEFVETENGALLSCVYVPVGAMRGAVVICSPLFSERLANYRREVALARALVSYGFAAIRFDYVGAGHSDGHNCDLSVESMIRDTVSVTGWAQGRLRTEGLIFVGTRLAAFAAAAAATTMGCDGLVLIEPALAGSSYFRELLRAKRLQSVASSSELEDPLETMRSVGWMDILGYQVGERLATSVSGLRLLDAAGRAAQRQLVVQIAPDLRPREAYREFVQQLADVGAQAQLRSIEGRPSWWFSGAHWFDAESRRVNDEVAREVIGWLAA